MRRYFYADWQNNIADAITAAGAVCIGIVIWWLL